MHVVCRKKIKWTYNGEVICICQSPKMIQRNFILRVCCLQQMFSGELTLVRIDSTLSVVYMKPYTVLSYSRFVKYLLNLSIFNDEEGIFY